MENEQKAILIIADRLQSLRKEAGLSKRKLAVALDMDEREIRRIEQGSSRLILKHLFRYAQHFELTLSELLRNVEEEL